MASGLLPSQLLTPFAPDVAAACNASVVAGSRFLIAPLMERAQTCYGAPREFEIKFAAAAAEGDTEVEIYLSGSTPAMTTPKVILQTGLRLFCGAARDVVVEIAEDVVLSATTALTAVTVAADVQGTIAINDTADTYAMFDLKSPTDLSQNDQPQSTDTYSIRAGLQGSMALTKLALQIPLTFHVRDSQDLAYHYSLFPASQSGQRVFCYVAYTGGARAYGNVIFQGLSNPAPQAGIQDGSSTADFQAPYVRTPSRQSVAELTPDRLDTYDLTEKLVGIYGLNQAA